MTVAEKTKVCSLMELEPYQGRAALIDGQQVALFSIPKHGVFAVQNWDPIGRAFVLNRGIVGDVDGELCVASPLYKQHFSLKTGICLENPQIKLKVYPVMIEDSEVLIGH